jgi:menaquinone-dependent protoporphyrinogen oxidase
MRVLIAYGSKRGGTQGLAEMVADSLRAEGHTVEVRRASEASPLEGYDAVIVGGALYALRWHKDARRFVRRNADELRKLPVFFFSSGPLDDSATEREITPVKGVQALMDRVGARGHVTFGGRLSAHARGFPASAMAKKQSGDWRDPMQARSWARSVSAELLADRRIGV